jgi:hypothetical protein
MVQGNVSTGNLGGILLSDETGPTAYDRVVGNMATRNLFECGITVVGHNPHAAPGGVPAPRVAGVYSNVIVGNHSSGNGTKGGGAGVVLATGLPGGAVYDNLGTVAPLSITVSDNVITGDHFGIWTTGPVTAAGERDNSFVRDAVAVARG